MLDKQLFRIAEDGYVFSILRICLVVLIVFYLVQCNYAVLHAAMDMMVVMVSFCIFVITLNTFKLNGERFYTTIGIGYGFSTLFLLLHILIGLEVYLLPGKSYNYATYLAFSGRALQTGVILYALLRKDRLGKNEQIIVPCLVVIVFAITTAVGSNLLPPFFSTTFTVPAKFCYGLLAAVAVLNFFLLRHSKIQLPEDVRSNLMVAQALDATEFCVFSQVSVRGDLASAVFTILSAMSSFYYYRAMIKPILTYPIEKLCQSIETKDEKLKHQEAEMARLQQLNTIGKMAATISHEIRNPMTTVRGYLQLMKRNQQFETYQTKIDLMIAELDRANVIITDYLSLAGNRCVTKTSDRLERIVKSLQPLLEAAAMMENKNIVFDLQNTRDLDVDEREIRQLVLNFVRNGLEAVGEHGMVQISTRLDGGSVVLAVTDNGDGIPAEVLPRLGTPFFTTKQNGTGLGLAVCYSIASKHNAVIDGYNSVDGAVFEVRFVR